jgi:hypothetical protein
MPYTENTYAIGALNDEVASTTTAVGIAIDLANYFSVGKREVKFIVATNWGSTVAATAETVTVYFAESDSTSSVASTSTDWTAISGATVTSAVGGEATTECNALVSKRYVHARAVCSTSATAIFGVAAIILPLRRFSF